MAYTQDDINNIVNGIVNTYTGQRIGYHGGYVGECTSPAKYYVENLIHQQAPYMANDRADGWGTNFPAELAPYFLHESFVPGKAYPKGTILMWNSPHIAIVLHSDGSNNVEVFEQNADPDGAPCKSISRVVNNAFHTCNYALIPTVSSAPVIPQTPPPPPYTVVETFNPAIQVITNKQPTTKWGMNYDNFQSMEAHPIMQVNQGTMLTITEKLHHINGYDYYREANNVDAWNVADCDLYTPPPKPYIPPAPPVTVPPAEKYTVVVPMDGFKTASDAKNQQNYYQPVAPGTYFVYGSKDLGMVNISLDNMKAGVWINPELNEVPQVPPATLPVDPPPPPIIEPVNDTSATSTVPVSNTAWKITKSLRSNGQPVVYNAINTEPIRLFNLEYPNQSFIMEPYNGGKPVKLVSHFWKPDANNMLVEYGRTPSMVRQGVYYDLKMSDLRLHQETIVEAAEDVIRADVDTWSKFLENGFTSAERFISDIKPKLSHSAYKGKQFIDGFRKGQKK